MRTPRGAAPHVGDANVATSKPRKGRNPTEVGLARDRGGEREDPEGANVRRVVSSGSGETGFGSETLSVGSKAPRSVQVWEGSRSAQVDEELPPQQRIPTRNSVGVRARWARRAEEDGNPVRQTTTKEHKDREDRYRSMDGHTLETKPSKCLWGGINPQAGGG